MLQWKPAEAVGRVGPHYVDGQNWFPFLKERVPHHSVGIVPHGIMSDG